MAAVGLLNALLISLLLLRMFLILSIMSISITFFPDELTRALPPLSESSWLEVIWDVLI